MAFAQAKYGFLLRSIPVVMSGKFSVAISADAFVVFAAALYLGFETKVSWPWPACSMPDTPVISVLGEALSRRAFRALAMSASFMAVSGDCSVSGLRCQVSGKSRSPHFTVYPRAMFLTPEA